MGYPADFKIPVSDTQAYKQFGNSVVVPVVERIADAVAVTLSRPADYKHDLVLSFAERPEGEEASPERATKSLLGTKRRHKRQ
jgi:hypothetical protein